MPRYRYHNRDLKDLGKSSRGLSLASISYPNYLLKPAVTLLVLVIAAWLYVLNTGVPVRYEDSTENVTEVAEASKTAATIEKNDSSEPVKAIEAIEQPPQVPQTAGNELQVLLAAHEQDWTPHTVKNGDTLYYIFKRLGIDTADATRIANAENSRQLTRLRPGKKISIRSNQQNSVVEIVYEDSPLTWVHALREGDEFTVTSHDLPLTRQQHQVAAHVNSSLYIAAQRAGISDKQIMNLTEIFGWDIDFSLNVQAGDSFKLIYDDIYVNGEKRADGDILAAEFINAGKVYRAIAYRDDSGRLKYYAPDGTSMQKTFLRSPVKFSRISSGFTRARYHPVLKRWRAHKGVDYAASRGTPVRSTADGKIAFIGRKGGYGKAIIINHGSTYSTLYGHLSGFSRGLKRGSSIHQGQTIGRVGSTGLATGPHLHYEFRINGRHVNPLTFRQPASAPIPESQKTAFMEISHEMERQLDAIELMQVATGSSSDNG